MATTAPPPHPALSLLLQAHPSSTASTIHQDQVRHRPLLLRPSSPDPSSATNKRTARRLARQRRHETQRREEAQRKRAGRSSLTARPRPLSAKEKRALGVHEITARERKWEIYVGLHGLWCDYMRDVLGVTPEGRKGRLSGDGAGPLLATADYHGALMRVVRSGCVSRVGVEGIVVRDTKFTFALITRRNEIKTVPKEGTIFRFELPVSGSCVDTQDAAKDQQSDTKTDATSEDSTGKTEPQRLVFELHGEQFRTSAPDRANKKFKQHYDPSI